MFFFSDSKILTDTEVPAAAVGVFTQICPLKKVSKFMNISLCFNDDGILMESPDISTDRSHNYANIEFLNLHTITRILCIFVG